MDTEIHLHLYFQMTLTSWVYTLISVTNLLCKWNAIINSHIVIFFDISMRIKLQVVEYTCSKKRLKIEKGKNEGKYYSRDGVNATYVSKVYYFISFRLFLLLHSLVIFKFYFIPFFSLLLEMFFIFGVAAAYVLVHYMWLGHVHLWNSICGNGITCSKCVPFTFFSHFYCVIFIW